MDARAFTVTDPQGVVRARLSTHVCLCRIAVLWETIAAVKQQLEPHLLPEVRTRMKDSEPKVTEVSTGEISPELASAANDQLDLESLKLEREKFEFDKKVRTGEIELKQAEAIRLANELEIKKGDALRSRWTNPFIVAIIGAILVGISNIAVSAFNGYSQRHLEDKTAQHQQELAERNNNYSVALEGLREENAAVLEVVKLGDPERVRAGLCMLVKLNSIKSPTTIYAVQSLAGQHGCSTISDLTQLERKADWVTAQLIVPGCGESGCNAQYQVCGSAPANTKTTGNVRNYTDSFGGAWGDWVGPPIITPTQVCRVFNQHSHNITRTVSFQFEVVPTS